MGILATLLSSSRTFGSTRNAVNTPATRELRALLETGDYDLPSSFAVANEIQSIAAHVAATGGTYTLTFTLHSGETFTTGNLAYDAAHATVQSAINSAATTASITDWTNDDIVVAGGPLSTTPMTFTFSGASVAGLNQGAIALDRALMTAAGTAGAAATSIGGTGSVDEVQTIAAHVSATGGTYTLSLTLNGDSLVTTSALAWNANAATITSAIDVAVAGHAAWTNGDIVVTGGPLSTGGITLTFSGASVTHANHGQTTINGASLTTLGTAGAVTQPTAGGAARAAWALLKVLGIVGGTIPDQGDNATAVTAKLTRGQFPEALSQDTIKALITEISVQDDNALLVAELNTLFGY